MLVRLAGLLACFCSRLGLDAVLHLQLVLGLVTVLPLQVVLVLDASMLMMPSTPGTGCSWWLDGLDVWDGFVMWGKRSDAVLATAVLYLSLPCALDSTGLPGD